MKWNTGENSLFDMPVDNTICQIKGEKYMQQDKITAAAAKWYIIRDLQHQGSFKLK